MPIHVFGNVGRGGNSERAISAMKSNSPKRAIIGFAEIDEGDTPQEHQILKSVFNGWNFAAFTRRVPVVYNPFFWELDGKVQIIELSPGITRVSPPRVLVIVPLRHRILRNVRVVRMNSHLIAGSKNGHVDSHEEERKKYWQQGWDIICREVQRLHKLGYNIVLTLDANAPQPHLNVEGLKVWGRRPDWMFAVPARGYDASISDTGEITLGIDFHRGLKAKVKFKKQRRPGK